jgi:hypothetical protein
MGVATRANIATESAQFLQNWVKDFWNSSVGTNRGRRVNPMKDNGPVDSYKLDWGCGPEIRVGDTVYRGGDSSPIPYIVKSLIFERGYGVKIITDKWSDCGLFLANSVDMWKKMRVEYLKWSTETIRERLAKADAEIEQLIMELAS